ncbi:restriction endonuclease subunit S [Desulfococcaceae bacterium HSG9]|nr:restriction endonuclease subunit S [Desulfococcaceae bacterium HSG9]
MVDWKEFKLKDVCDKITVGYVGPMAGEYRDSGIPFLRSRNIKPFKLDYEQLKFVDKNFHQKLKKSELLAGDVVVVRTGYPGTACVIPESLGVANCSDLVIIRTGKMLNSYFLTAIFNSIFGQKLVAGHLVGVAQQHFNITVAKELKLKFPPKKLQDKIAAILSAYDDLIENNKRRIALLEKMAEEIYREWFVRFRFPGYDKVKFKKGVPEGWKAQAIDTISDEIRKGIKKKDLHGDEKYIGLEHIPRKSIAIKDYATTDSIKSNKLLFKHQDILFSKIRPYLHKVALSHFDGVCSSDTIVIRSKNEKYEGFLLFTIFSETFVELATIASKGTKMPRADWDFLKKLELNIPSDDLLKKFQKIFNEIFTQIENILKANELLASSCDMLLPRLISGKFSVENLNIKFPPSMLADEQPEPQEAAHA